MVAFEGILLEVNPQAYIIASVLFVEAPTGLARARLR